MAKKRSQREETAESAEHEQPPLKKQKLIDDDTNELNGDHDQQTTAQSFLEEDDDSDDDDDSEQNDEQQQDDDEEEDEQPYEYHPEDWHHDYEGEEESGDDVVETADLDYKMQTALHALRNKDPLIYDEEHNFVEDAEDESHEQKHTQQHTLSNGMYPWVKQIDDEEGDAFLEKFFSQQLWKLRANDKHLSCLEVYRGYKGVKHNLDDFSEDERELGEQRRFERYWQSQSEAEFKQQCQEQSEKKQTIELNDQPKKWHFPKRVGPKRWKDTNEPKKRERKTNGNRLHVDDVNVFLHNSD
eukprot:CAMPEP_0197026470 /NCGR_PEP_ID=MMETSP1384-20130603/6547_1 /TAXON_ID=29189 /ORGANISM="Ammonia sp." /LENGTH=298 /DNA_ID=CAMNT_0042455141 /DNA_START=33 /DNA_END=929 /DNA_ORIENTATION=-